MSSEHNGGGISPDSADVEQNGDKSDAPASTREQERGTAGRSGEPGKSRELEEAMAEAVAAVEGRASGGEGAPSAGEAVTEALISARKELEEALEQTQKEAAQLRDRWMRAAADLENYRRRAAKEREDVQRFGIEKLLRDFLPVVDDLERALSIAEGADNATAEQLLGGVRLVQKKFLSTLEKHGVTTFESKGEPFNPERHEAVQQAHSPVAAGAVADQLQRGFLLHDRLLRPALVVVSLGPEGGEATEGSE